MGVDDSASYSSSRTGRGSTQGHYTLLPTSEPGWDGKADKQSRAGAAGGTKTLVDRWRAGEFTITPENNPVIDVWDVFVIVALFATALVLPFEVALVVHPSMELVVIDRFIDCTFIVDIILTFNIAYPLRDNVTRVGDTYERSPLLIAKHYMAVPFSENFTAGWFWPDVLTVVPWEVVTGTEQGLTLKLVRVLRLVRMLRLVRVVKLFKRWHTHMGFSFALVKILTVSGITLLLVHWLACLWAHLGVNCYEYTGHRESWLSLTHLAKEKDVSDFELLETYRLALYFCTVVLTTVGFGDLVPLNDVEAMLMTVTIFTTGLTWAWVVANVVDVIAHMDVYGLHFNQIMDDMNVLMSSREVSLGLQTKVRKHLHEAYHVLAQRHNQGTMKWLSEGLQGELAVAAGVDQVCAKIWYLRDMDQASWMIDIAQHFQEAMFSPNEFIMDRWSLSVIRKGSCARRGRLLFRDAVIGDDMILATEVLKETTCPRTLTLCEVMTLHRDALIHVCEKHEELNQRLRKAQIRLAIWRAFIYTARKIKSRREKVEAKASKGKKRASQAHWEAAFGDHTNGENEGHFTARHRDEEDFIASLFTRKRTGWVEGGVPVNAAGLAATRRAREEAARTQELLESLRSLGQKVVEGRQQTMERLEALNRRLEQVDRRTEALERLRQLETPPSPRVSASLTPSPQPSPLASPTMPGSRLGARPGSPFAALSFRRE